MNASPATPPPILCSQSAAARSLSPIAHRALPACGILLTLLLLAASCAPAPLRVEWTSMGTLAAVQCADPAYASEARDIVRRAFDGMTEITSMVAMHGARGNRGEMSEVERMLEEKGLAHAFARVFL